MIRTYHEQRSLDVVDSRKFPNYNTTIEFSTTSPGVKHGLFGERHVDLAVRRRLSPDIAPKSFLKVGYGAVPSVAVPRWRGGRVPPVCEPFLLHSKHL